MAFSAKCGVPVGLASTAWCMSIVSDFRSSTSILISLVRLFVCSVMSVTTISPTVPKSWTMTIP